MTSEMPEVMRSTRPRVGRIRVMLPAYNEEKTLGILLDRLDLAFEESGLEGDVLVVNDGSTDRTVEVARAYTGKLPVDVLDLQPNRGLAGAMRAGLAEVVSRSEPQDIILTMDADNSHPPGLIPRLVQMVREGNDVVIASRYQIGSRVRGVPPHRELMSWGARFLFQALIRLPGVRDYTCGYRAYRSDLVRSALRHYGEDFITERGFGCMAEILVKLKMFEPIYGEAPMVLRYDHKFSDSKMQVLRTVRQTLLLLFRSAFRK